MLCIILNSFCLALYDFSDREDLTTKNKVLAIIGDVFTVLFLLECILRIVAMGFIIG
jgi:hypothetical protein